MCRRSVFTLAVSGFSATMNMKLRLTRSVPLHMQMMQPSKSASVLPMASNDDKILGSLEEEEAGQVSWAAEKRDDDRNGRTNRKQKGRRCCLCNQREEMDKTQGEVLISCSGVVAVNCH